MAPKKDNESDRLRFDEIEARILGMIEMMRRKGRLGADID